MDTETAFAAAYDVAEQAYTTEEQVAATDATTSAQVQTAGDTAQATAIAAVVFASPPQPLSFTGPATISYQGTAAGDPGLTLTESITAAGTGASVNVNSASPLTVSADITAPAAIDLQAQTESPSTTTGDDLTVNSDATVQSTASSVTLLAGDNVDIASGSTIQAGSYITITANANDDPSGATVTVAGTLIAQSASIGVDPNARGNETFDITPSATTPISVNGGSDTDGDNTLNFNADGQDVTIAETVLKNVATYTITAAGHAASDVHEYRETQHHQ